MNLHRLLNEVGANYSAYRVRSFVGVLTQHQMEANKCASRMFLPRLWSPAIMMQQRLSMDYGSMYLPNTCVCSPIGVKVGGATASGVGSGCVPPSAEMA